MILVFLLFFFFFFNDTATTEIYTLSLHDALPISVCPLSVAHELLGNNSIQECCAAGDSALDTMRLLQRSEEHTSELQSQSNLVCRLLLEKKKKKKTRHSSLTIGSRDHALYTMSTG